MILRKNFIFYFLLLITNTVLADEYDDLRAKWKVILTGGTAYSTTNTYIAGAITNITANANAQWNSMNKTTGRTHLWSDLSSTSDASHLTSNYYRLKIMALAYSTTGSSLKGNTSLKADIVSAMDWMYTNRYNENKVQYGNWWDWDIGSPLAVNDIVIMMYSDFTSTQIINYMNVINSHTASVSVNDTGANRVWKATVIIGAGIISKSTTKMVIGRDALSGVFPYVTNGDGFYTDGSFIQHGDHPYTGGYGKDLINDIANVVYVLEGSTWVVTDSNKGNIYQWVYSFSHLMYKGGIMDMVRGREISRSYQSDHMAGHVVINAIIQLSQFAPSTNAAAFKSMVKYWIQQDVSRNYFNYAPINMIVLGEAIVNNTSITPMIEPIRFRYFPEMDRAVHFRTGFAAGVSMHSTRIYNYESINNENTGGDHTSDGALYLYNSNLSQFSDNFWNTINNNRIPGTTVLRGSDVAESQKSTQSWVGGANLAVLYGAVGMDLKPAGKALNAKKSWFMLDDEIVALGTGITSTDGIVVESIVENRKLNSSGNNVLTVNGTAKSSTLGWTETMTSVNWAHLQGSVSGSDIGYYFPTASTVSALREARTGNWSDIGTSSGSATKNYLTMYFDHGSNPTNKTYSYVILPNMSSSAVSAYAASPEISVLENSTAAQGVKESGLGITAVNFWADASKTVDVLTCNKKASVVFRETGSDYEIAVTDPTWLNTGTISITINKSAVGTISNDSRITVTQLSPTIILSINVNGLKGRTVSAKFSKGTSKTSDLVHTIADAVRWIPAGEAVKSASTLTNLEFAPNAAKDFSIIPNPASSIARLSFTAQTAGGAKINIFNQAGLSVFNTETIIAEGDNDLEINIQKLSFGIYIIKLQIDNETVMTRKLIKE